MSADAAERLRGINREAPHAFQAEPGLMQAPAACASLRDGVASLMASALARGLPGGGDEDGPAERVQAAGRAEAFIKENPAKPITMADLIEAGGVSERALRAGFVDRYGSSPKAHLTVLRLNAVWSALRSARDAGLSVAQAAMDHLGRFSGAYRRHFGELPSETLRQARGI